MGRLTDLLSQKGMLGDPAEQENTQEEKSKNYQKLHDRYEEADLKNEVQEALKNLSQRHVNKKSVFQNLPHLDEFCIPKSMNGRIIDCNEAAFRPFGDQQVVFARAYSFDGRHLKFIYHDPSDGTLQTGRLEEFPRDGYGARMGRLGFDGNLLVWISKAYNGV